MVKQATREYLITEDAKKQFPDLINYEQEISDIWSMGCENVLCILECKMYPLSIYLSYSVLVINFSTEIKHELWNARCYSLMTLLKQSLIPEKIFF